MSSALIAAAMARDRDREVEEKMKVGSEASSPAPTVDLDEKQQRVRLEELLELGRSINLDEGLNDDGMTYAEDFEVDSSQGEPPIPPAQSNAEAKVDVEVSEFPDEVAKFDKEIEKHAGTNHCAFLFTYVLI